jgi:hypothetical protein
MLFVQQGSGGAPEQKLNAFFGKSARIVRVPGLGAEAAAAFSKNTKEGAEGLENIMADDKKWNVDFRALGVGDETTKEFAAAKEVVRTALDRLSSLK